MKVYCKYCCYYANFGNCSYPPNQTITEGFDTPAQRFASQIHNQSITIMNKNNKCNKFCKDFFWWVKWTWRI